MSRFDDDPTEARLATLVDRDAYEQDAIYHAHLSLFRRWLQMTRMALEDEGVHPFTAERVVNRMVYGAPTAEGAHERVAEQRRQVEQLCNNPAMLNPDLEDDIRRAAVELRRQERT